MKVLIIGQLDNPHVSGKFYGGVEKSETDLIHALCTRYEVTALLPKDSSEEFPENVDIRFFPLNSRRSFEKRVSKYYETQFEYVKKVASEGFDVIISNSKRSPMVRKLSSISHPNFINVIHILPSSYGMTGLDLFKAFYESHEAGHKILSVSKYAAEEINEFAFKAKWVRENGLSKAIVVSDVSFPIVYCEAPVVVSESIFNGVAIGRSDDIRKLDFAAELFQNIPNSAIFCPQPGSNKEKEYFEKNLSVENVDVFVEKPHHYIMDRLSYSSFLLATSPKETFGISNFEAAQRGIPIVLNTKNFSHSSLEFIEGLPHTFIIDTFRKRRKEILQLMNEKIEDIYDLSLTSRQEIADSIYERYNKEKFLERIQRVIDL